ncbi:MAG: hemolysin family protein [Bacillota bacterium]
MTAYWQEFVLILGLVLLNAFFAAGEIATISARPVRIKQLAEDGNRSAQALLRLTADHSRFLATIQVGITLAGFLASASAAVGMSDDLGLALARLGLPAGVARPLGLVAVTLIISYLTLVLGELVPKRLALQAPERIALFVARPVEWVAKATGPFTALLTQSTNLVVRMLGGKVEQQEATLSEEELRFYVEEHRELYQEEKNLIAGVFDFGDRLVRQLMVPRPEMECIHQDAPLSEALQFVRTHGYWRYPVYREDYDDIVGIITVKDLVQHVGETAPDERVAAIMRPARFVPEAKRALELLKELQTADEQMAIVVDEYGGVAGLVTMEDLLQEIVGDVAEEPVLTREQRESERLIDGAEPVEDVAELLDVKIPSSPNYETLAGFILDRLGEIPQVGDKVTVDGWTLVVEKMEGHRIDQVRAVPPAPATEE